MSYNPNIINLDLIFNIPIINKKIKLIIYPLAPISMVSDIPGAYYKTEEVPDKFKICGLFENILGWHFDKLDRAAINKKRKEVYKKKYKINIYNAKYSSSGFQPLLYDYFEIGMIVKQRSMHFNDLWKREFSRLSDYVHMNGTPNIDYDLLKIKPPDLDNAGKSSFLKENKTKFPMFYTTPTLREYVECGSEIQISLQISEHLFTILNNSIDNNSTGYLGNSEGWVEIKLEEI